MAPPDNVSVGGPRPISYIEEGKQWFIPLGFITLVDGQAQVNSEALDAAGINVDISDLESWIDRQLETGEIAPTATPPPQPAFALSAERPGTAGNHISATVKQNPLTEGSVATFDLTVRLTERFERLELNATNDTGAANPYYLETQLASSVLITVEAPTGGYMFPKAYPGTAEDGSDLLTLTGGGTDTESAAIAEQPDGGTAFTVKAKETGEQGDNISVVIMIESLTVFSMTVQMQETYEAVETSEKRPDDSDNPQYIGTLLEDSYLVSFRKSDDVVHLPANGTYNLTGGQDAMTASTLLIG